MGLHKLRDTVFSVEHAHTFTHCVGSRVVHEGFDRLSHRASIARVRWWLRQAQPPALLAPSVPELVEGVEGVEEVGRDGVGGNCV